MFMASRHYYLSLNRHQIHSKNLIDAAIHFYHLPIDRHRFHFQLDIFQFLLKTNL